MAPKDIFSFVGHEHGGNLPTGGAVNGTSGFNAMQGAPVSGKYGRRGYQWEYIDGTGGSGSAPAYVHTFGTGSSVAVGVARGYFAFAAFPTGRNMSIAVIYAVQGGTPCVVVRLRPDGFIEAGWISAATSSQGGTLSPVVTSTTRSCPERWHRLDLRVTGSATPVFEWMIDGVPQPTLNIPTAQTTWSQVRWGNAGNFTDHAGALTSLYLDDSAIGSVSADYPYGPGESFLLRVASWDPAFPGQQLAWPLDITKPNFTFEDLTPITVATTPSSVWSRIASGIMQPSVSPASAANDGLSLRMTSPFKTAVIILGFEQLTLRAGAEISCVIGWEEKYQSPVSVAGVTAGLRIYTSTPTGIVQQLLRDINPGSNDQVIGQAMNDGSSTFMERLIIPTGGWSQAQLNSLKMRWGSENDSATADRWLGISLAMLEVHVTSSDEPGQVGCTIESWGSIA